MARYIDAETAFNLIKEQKGKETGAFSKGLNKGLHIAMRTINNKEVLPAADVVEVKHGEWTAITIKGKNYAQVYYQHKDCSVNETQMFPSPYDYCPLCGAKMDGKPQKEV